MSSVDKPTSVIENEAVGTEHGMGQDDVHAARTEVRGKDPCRMQLNGEHVEYDVVSTQQRRVLADDVLERVNRDRVKDDLRAECVREVAGAPAVGGQLLAPKCGWRRVEDHDGEIASE